LIIFSYFNAYRFKTKHRNFNSKWRVSLDILVANGVVGKNDLVKILGRGELKATLNVTVHKFTATAKAAIEAAGGQVVTL